MVYKNFSKYDIDLDKQIVFSKSFNKNRPLKLNKNNRGYTRCPIVDDLGNKYHFWHQVLFCIKHNTTLDSYRKNNLEIDHITPVIEGGIDDIENLRLVTHKQNMNNEKTLNRFSKTQKGKKMSEETKRKISKANKGRKMSNEQYEKAKIRFFKKGHIPPFTGKKVLQIKEDGTKIEYKSQTEAALANDLDVGNIGKACKGKYWSKGHKYMNSEWYYI